MRKVILMLVFLALTTCVYANSSSSDNDKLFDIKPGWYNESED